jgi:4-hydroxy-2-oxoheptanedioate aldolase
MQSAEMREAMRGGRTLFGLGVRLARSPEIAKVAKACGYDWLFVDLEHSSLDIDQASQLCLAAASAGIVPLVRVPGHEPTIASRMLDGGAGGIVVPHVDTPEEIKPFVERCRFAPQGKRSLGGLLPQLDYAALPPSEAMRRGNEQTLLCAMIESPKAVSNAEAIAAVDGVDLLLFGSNDLAIEMGIPGQFEDPRLEEAYRTVLAAAGRHGKSVGLGGVYTKDLLTRYLPLGFGFVLLGSDLTTLMRAAREQVGMAAELVKG